MWTITPDPDSAGLVSSEPPVERIAIAVEASLEPELAWAPDGSALLVSDGEWIYRVDATPSGNPRGTFVQVVKGRSPAWQPLPAGSEPIPSPTSEPSVSASPEPAGRDIGLGFPLCNIERLSGIDWSGDGTEGAAWTGARTNDGDAVLQSVRVNTSWLPISTVTARQSLAASASSSSACSVARSPRRT